jgi:uncharacterized protein
MKIKKIPLLIFLISIFFQHNIMAQQHSFKALLVTKTSGWHHESLHYAVVALKKLAKEKMFDVKVWEDPNGFTDKYLEQFQVIIFLSTSGNIFDSTQQKVMERFVQSGKGFVGIHSASDTEYDWPWYNKLVGRMFHIHPVVQTAKLKIVDATFPGLEGFANDKLWTDEQYEFGEEKVTDLKYILAVDEASYNPKAQWGDRIGNGMGKFHPLAWYHNFDGGRSFYTALGHLSTIYSDKAFLNHVYAGILWAAAAKK